ncbi:hypothetical protein GGR57DRAFT_464754 [Xylariaceae sp. FL1272]|nr:hypothetical protein GGR57DRAFT_464754 [Xylariaceae sp. FL1272]
MSPAANSETLVLPNGGAMTYSHADGGDLAKGPRATNGAGRGSGKAPFRHIDDIVSVTVSIDPHTPLRRLLEIGDSSMRQALTFNQFGRPDMALQEYIKAFTIAVDKVPKHKDYPSLKADRGDLNRMYQALKVKITNSGAIFDKVKEEIKDDNMRSGAIPTRPHAEQLLSSLPSAPSATPRDRIARSELTSAYPSSNGLPTAPSSKPDTESVPGRRMKPTIHPKPESLHGNAIRSSSEQARPDLAARFAKLRKSNAPSHISLDSSVPTMPKMPDAIYSPARGTMSPEVANLPSSLPRGMLSRTNSIASAPSLASRTSMDSTFKSFGREQFAAAHTYGQAQDAAPGTKVRIPRGDAITVNELVRCMGFGDANVKILLIDVRDRESFQEGHIMSQKTICIEPSVLEREHISVDEILDSMVLSPDQEKEAVENRNHFDLVVFYDQSSQSIPTRSRTTDKEGIVLYNLQQALSNYSELALKNVPKLLIGGLDAWVDTVGAQSLAKTVPNTGNARSTTTRRRMGTRRLKPEERKEVEDMIARDQTAVDYATSVEAVMRRYPSIKTGPESMMSSGQDDSSGLSDIGGDAFLKDIATRPPVRPKPSVARTRYSGLESREEAPAGVAMQAAAVGRLTGLVNPGSWCYSNASLQALLASAGFSDELVDASWPTRYQPNVPHNHPSRNQLMCKILGNLFQWLSRREFPQLKTTTLMHYLRSIHEGYVPTGRTEVLRFGDKNQHDSDEFATFIMGQLAAETRITVPNKQNINVGNLDSLRGAVLQTWVARGDLSFVHKYWHLVEVSELTCNSCGERTHVANPNSSLTVHVPREHNNGTMALGLADYFGPEPVYSTCDSCSKQGKQLQRRIARFPPLLRVSIGRFLTINNGDEDRGDRERQIPIKNLNHFQFPETLDLAQYGSSREDRRQIGAQIEGEAGEGFDVGTVYDLYAVILHNGPDANSGHYIAYINLGADDWWNCNDTHITKVNGFKSIAQSLYRCQGKSTPVQTYYRRRDYTYQRPPQ